jgi:eukaryotic-like serine/threonine-protein kinase
VLAERIREKVAAEPVPTRAGPVRVTISVGLAERAGAAEDLASVLARADEALYAAKQAGRNRVWDDAEKFEEKISPGVSMS